MRKFRLLVIISRLVGAAKRWFGAFGCIGGALRLLLLLLRL